MEISEKDDARDKDFARRGLGKERGAKAEVLMQTKKEQTGSHPKYSNV